MRETGAISSISALAVERNRHRHRGAHARPGPYLQGSADQLGAIVDLIGEGVISGKIAKDLFEIVWSEGGEPSEIAAARGMKQVTDLGAIEAAVDEIIAANPDKAAAVADKPQAIGWFVGQAMKATGGKANPAQLNDLLRRKLDG